MTSKNIAENKTGIFVSIYMSGSFSEPGVDSRNCWTVLAGSPDV